MRAIVAVVAFACAGCSLSLLGGLADVEPPRTNEAGIEGGIDATQSDALIANDGANAVDPYGEAVRVDAPVEWWRLDQASARLAGRKGRDRQDPGTRRFRARSPSDSAKPAPSGTERPSGSTAARISSSRRLPRLSEPAAVHVRGVGDVFGRGGRPRVLRHLHEDPVRPGRERRHIF